LGNTEAILSSPTKQTSTNQMLAGLLVGTVLGLIFGEKMTQFRILGDVFITLLQMAAFPLIFFNIITAVAKLPDFAVMRRIGTMIMAYYIITMACAAAIGVTVMSLLKVGTGFRLANVKAPEANAMPGWSQVILDMLPRNAVASFSNGKLLQVVIFALFIGITIVFLDPEDKAKLTGFFEIFNKLFRRMIMLVMKYGPIGVTFLMAASVGAYKSSFFGPVGKYVVAVYIADVLQFGLIYVLFVALVLRGSPWRLFSQSVPVVATASSTCSSLATLPVCMRVAEDMKIPEQVYGVTLPLGAAFNKDGTTLVFTAVLTFAFNALGLPLTGATIFMMILMSTLISLGGEGIPMAGVVQLTILLPAFGLPVEFAALFAGIWRITEMPMVALNCIGDLIGTWTVHRFAYSSTD
jgi:Na+/H+-dicarboxylate symporter